MHKRQRPENAIASGNLRAAIVEQTLATGVLDGHTHPLSERLRLEIAPLQMTAAHADFARISIASLPAHFAFRRRRFSVEHALN
jgi:hypothetical protein